MITNLHARNFATIDEVDIELDGGLTVLTGETGAGKSILVDALGLALGDRAPSGVVRNGERHAEIGVVVNAAELAAVREWLDQQMLGTGDECVLRRVISAEGRSRAFINDRPVPLTSLKTLAQQLVDIHGQHAHQSLTRPETQRRLLDHHGGLGDLAAETAAAFRAWQDAQRALEETEREQREHAAHLELLRHQVHELQALDPEPGEYEQLLREHERLVHSGRLLEETHQALNLLYEGDEAAQPLLARGSKLLEPLAELDATLAPACHLLREAEIQVDEAAAILRQYRETLELDPAHAERVDERLHDIRALARKHRVEAGELHRLLPQLKTRLEAVENAAGRLAQLTRAADEAATVYRRCAEELHQRRVTAAAELGEQVTAAMQSLGLEGGHFAVAVNRPEPERPGAHGLNRIEFMVTTNPGQPPQPLARVASGGELSRIALAIQVIGADGNTIPCMVFDEVDAGIGGGVAEIVGRRLRELGENRQVLCVTHLPQVASQGHQHLRVHKQAADGCTRTVVTPLRGDQQVEELARMLGGVRITKRTRAHAAEMLAGARR